MNGNNLNKHVGSYCNLTYISSKQYLSAFCTVLHKHMYTVNLLLTTIKNLKHAVCTFIFIM